MCDQTPAKGGSNYTSYCNPTVDQAEKTQMSNPDKTVRKQQFHIIHTQLLKDNPLMYYYSSSNIAVATNKLHNYNPSPLGPTETWNIWDWWLS
jgi:ABC-type transport system substrate-binding protein